MHGASPPTVRRRLLTTGAAAVVAACDRSTIVRAIERGELEAVCLGTAGNYRIPAEALERWLQPAGPDDGEVS